VSTKYLAIYLKDHHAGSEAALEILDHIEAAHGAGAAGAMVKRLRPEFLAERAQLVQLLSRLDDSVSVPRRVMGWLSEKALELKLLADDSSDGSLHLLESVETLRLGVHGKLGLWKALAESQQLVPVLSTVDYAPLIVQAEAQSALIESVRLDASRAVFAGSE
jgi:hypothetical protein